jgi:hypothetical protein
MVGTYSAHGDPGPANAHAGLYNVVWPTAGSLTAMIESGANGAHRHGATTVQFAQDAPGRPVFIAFDAGGKTLELVTREWQCVDGILETRTQLSSGTQARESEPIDESVIRLWAAFDGALIAENTVERARLTTFGPSADRRALARFYFRFAPASPIAETP